MSYFSWISTHHRYHLGRGSYKRGFPSGILFLLLLGGMCIGTLAHAQRYLKPPFDSSLTMQDLYLEEINFTKQYTIVSVMYDNGFRESNQVIYISPDMFIHPRGTNQKILIIKAEGIPMLPEERPLNRFDGIIRFRLFFPPLNPIKCRNMDIYEDVSNGFNFFNIWLLPQA
jgi:hypothetical protein